MEEIQTMCRTRSDVSVVGATETLRAQQQLLQKLYVELDEERDASATAAREAMDMILRLQGEKAVVEMEASQFKRMAEEKIGHAEATLEAFEELLYEKEMETASLKFQLQAYKDKLVSLGCDLNASEFQYVQSNTSDQNGSPVMRRLKSMPPIRFKKIPTLRESVDRKGERSSASAQVSGDQEPSLVCGSGTLDSYWNKIRMLHEQVKLISDSNNIGTNLRNKGGRLCSILSQASNKINSESTLARTAFSDHSCSTNVHDVFEVPQATGKHEFSYNEGKRMLEKRKSVADIRLTKLESVSKGMVESHFKHDADKGNGTVTIAGQEKEWMGFDHNSQDEVDQRIVRLQRQRASRRYHDITCGFESGYGEEQLRLLKDIKTELKLIQSEMSG
ncbi:putative Zein-binding domain-containing protein [Medicago truncatula]|uniref:Putative Zein-binding domain-containing protein n=1 Tax=Medicago truncatula TaxID=3880 RepID=A0A396JC32_MEDTR|nr:uncharacterized protein LOC120578203 [Medicago truncatula]RHN74151.1 putative Zein-binding domain-containing protein [Medicago truncatula]